jgi:RimJ/RimL family protein N-acetyltransferase
LTTERLRLRSFDRDDVDALHLVLGDAELMRYYPHAFTRAETGEWIERQMARYERDGHGLWAMELKRTGEVIGDCGLVWQDVEATQRLEVGWHVRRDLCNKGYATEAGRICRDYAFSELAAPELISLVRPENVPSGRVAEKLGMSVEGTTLRGPGWVHNIYSMSRPLDSP